MDYCIICYKKGMIVLVILFNSWIGIKLNLFLILNIFLKKRFILFLWRILRHRKLLKYPGWKINILLIVSFKTLSISLILVPSFLRLNISFINSLHSRLRTKLFIKNLQILNSFKISKKIITGSQSVNFQMRILTWILTSLISTQDHPHQKTANTASVIKTQQFQTL